MLKVIDMNIKNVGVFSCKLPGSVAAQSIDMTSRESMTFTIKTGNDFHMLFEMKYIRDFFYTLMKLKTNQFFYNVYILKICSYKQLCFEL